MRTNTAALKQNDTQYALAKIEAAIHHLTQRKCLRKQDALRVIKDYADGGLSQIGYTRRLDAAATYIGNMADDLLKETRLKGAEIHNLMFQVYYAG